MFWGHSHLLLKVHPTCVSSRPVPPPPPPQSLCSRHSILVPLRFLSAGESSQLLSEVWGASLLTKEQFEIPFLEKNVPPSPCVSGCRDSAPIGIWFGSLMENPVRE